jgi:hypothetical protein
MPANVDAMVRAGAQAYRNGNKSEARALLERAIEIDEYNESAWLWLSAVVDAKDDQRTCLENVLTINPDNERARKGLRSLGVDPDTFGSGATATDTPAADPPAEQTPAFTDDYDEYSVPSSSASVSGGESYTEDDYDQWMEDLDLGDTTTAETAGSGDAYGEAVFDDDDFSAGAFDDVSFDEDIQYDDYSYDEPAASGQEAIFTGDYEDYDTGEAASPEAAFEEDMASDQYDTPADDDTYYEDEGEFYEDDEFYDEEGYYEDEYAYTDSPDTAVDEDPFEEEMPADAGVAGIAEFDLIPAEIEATRLPGEHEEGSSGAMLTGVLLLFNLLAVGFIAAQFLL